jgi:hypothetical protein
MDQNFTQEDLIRFIYQETSKEENFNILKKLESDIMLREELTHLIQTLDMLNELKFNPSETTLNIIIEEAGSASLETT